MRIQVFSVAAPNGSSSTINEKGNVDLTGPFFQSLGTNGRSCATCHLPRQRLEGSGSVTVEHNQNANLRPNEKMVRTVCLPCHGLTFSLDSLADRPLIARNFAGQPRHVVTAVDMALRRRGRT